MNKKQLEDAFNSVGIMHYIKQTEENNRTQITIETTDIAQLVKLIYIARETINQQP